MSRMRSLHAAAVLLFVLALGLTARAFAAGENSSGLPDEGLARRALEDYERAEKELNDLERAFKDQRVKGRLTLKEKEDLFRDEERKQAPKREEDLARRRTLETILDALGSSEVQRIADYQAEIDQLKAREAERNKQIAALRKDVVQAEEELQLLERQQVIQRRKVLAKLQMAEARMALSQGIGSTTKTLENRLDALEEKIDRLLRDMDQLRRRGK